MNRASFNLFQIDQKSNIHNLAIELLKRNPDTHFITLLELYRNCQLDPVNAQKVINALLSSVENLGPANRLMSKHFLSPTIKHLKTQL